MTPDTTATAPANPDAISAWFSSLTAYEWIGLAVAVVLFIYLLCKLMGVEIFIIIAELLSCFAD